MLEVVQSVYYRHLRVPGEFERRVMTETPEQNSVRVPAEDLCRVRDGFTPSEVQVLGVEVQRGAAHLYHADLERDPGPRRGLLEYHSQCHVPQWLVEFAVLLTVLQVRCGIQ